MLPGGGPDRIRLHARIICTSRVHILDSSDFTVSTQPAKVFPRSPWIDTQMHQTTFQLAVLGLVAGLASADSCATGIHLIVARGSLEVPGTGRIGVVAGNVSLQIPGSTTTAVNYPATFVNYIISEQAGAIAIRTLVTEYVTLCPQARIALLGYSQASFTSTRGLYSRRLN